ncbi:hypothetical protein TNCV_788121 [Trichonephila clavipes]|nr:hypothetical protein TNCV_788121 [Trichonephila clavipes]
MRSLRSTSGKLSFLDVPHCSLTRFAAEVPLKCPHRRRKTFRRRSRRNRSEIAHPPSPYRRLVFYGGKGESSAEESSVDQASAKVSSGDRAKQPGGESRRER